MSIYTTGEIAKLCNVSVRTVQYYDTRNILKPSAISEGGRRLYNEEDVKRMRIICFLREMGISISSIEELLKETEPEKVISILIEQQEELLIEEVTERQSKIELLGQMKKELKSIRKVSVESIGDIAYMMENKKELKKLRAVLLLTGIPVTALEWFGLIYGFITGNWWPCIIYVLIVIPYGIWISKYYFDKVAYICPECHAIFKPKIREAFWAKHTPTLRNVTCTACGHKGFCVEVWGGDGK